MTHTMTVAQATHQQLTPGATKTVALSQLFAHQGRLSDFALTPAGSKVIQDALRLHPNLALPLVRSELGPHSRSLILDHVASDAVKQLLEVDPAFALKFFSETAQDAELWTRLCTDSAHSRRLLIHLLTSTPTQNMTFLFEIVIANAVKLACDKNGCLALQRIMSDMSADHLCRAEAQCIAALVELATDAHGHYLITFLTEHGNVRSNVAAMAAILCQESILRTVITNKFGSSCVEKALRAYPCQMGTAVAGTLSRLSDAILADLANDSVANYVVQAAASVPHINASAGLIARLEGLTSSLAFGEKMIRYVTTVSSKMAQSGPVIDTPPTISSCRNVPPASLRYKKSTTPALKIKPRVPPPLPTYLTSPNNVPPAVVQPPSTAPFTTAAPSNGAYFGTPAVYFVTAEAAPQPTYIFPYGCSASQPAGGIPFAAPFPGPTVYLTNPQLQLVTL